MKEIKIALKEIKSILLGQKLDPWMTLREACTYCRISESTLRRNISAGRMKVSRATGRLLFKRNVLDRFIRIKIMNESDPLDKRRKKLLDEISTVHGIEPGEMRKALKLIPMATDLWWAHDLFSESLEEIKTGIDILPQQLQEPFARFFLGEIRVHQEILEDSKDKTHQATRHLWKIIKDSTKSDTED